MSRERLACGKVINSVVSVKEKFNPSRGYDSKLLIASTAPCQWTPQDHMGVKSEPGATLGISEMQSGPPWSAEGLI